MQRARDIRIHLIQLFEYHAYARRTLRLILRLGRFSRWLFLNCHDHSYRKTSTGVMRVALRAGYSVASRLTPIATAAIQTPSHDRGSNGT